MIKNIIRETKPGYLNITNWERLDKNSREGKGRERQRDRTRTLLG